MLAQVFLLLMLMNWGPFPASLAVLQMAMEGQCLDAQPCPSNS